MDAKKLGINIELLSSTKYISGGATSVGGLIIEYGGYDWKQSPHLAQNAIKHGPFALMQKLRRESLRNLGACMTPHNAYLQTLGLETMDLRIKKSCQNALFLAKYLESHCLVDKVHYPGLKSSPYYHIAKTQFGDRCGALLTFDLKSWQDCFKFINALKIIRRATNLNDNKSLIIHPASTIYCEYSLEIKRQLGVRETMLRLAVGIEDAMDLESDIEQALQGISR